MEEQIEQIKLNQQLNVIINELVTISADIVTGKQIGRAHV